MDRRRPRRLLRRLACPHVWAEHLSVPAQGKKEVATAAWAGAPPAPERRPWHPSPLSCSQVNGTPAPPRGALYCIRPRTQARLLQEWGFCRPGGQRCSSLCGICWCRATEPSPGPAGHTHSLWFKSTLLLFLRLLLSTKKKMACQTFFFFFQENRPQRMVYYRFTNMERTVRTHCNGVAL